MYAHARGPAHHALGERVDRGFARVETPGDLAVAQHGDVVGDREHLVEPVGDEQDAVLHPCPDGYDGAIPRRASLV